MSPQYQESAVLGYHGTSAEVADEVMSEGFHLSRNGYDWLGDGVYFFQDGLHRAWEWARDRYGDNGAVIGAEIRIVDCLDLLDGGWNEVISDGYDKYLEFLRDAGLSRPTQSGGAHPLDREVINYTVAVLNESGIRVTCVRAAFREGRPVYPDSALFDRSHVQIAVLDTEVCIQRTWRECEPK